MSCSSAGRLGGLKSWSRTVDRTARTAPARERSPWGITYHLERLDAELFANATDAQKLAAAEAARKHFFAEMARRSAESRRKGGAA